MMMRRFPLSVCLAATSLMTLAASAVAETPPVEEILARHAEARGGAELQSLKVTGTFTYNGIDSPYTLYRMRPDRFRFELEASIGTVISAFDGEIAWRQGPDRSGEIQVRVLEDEASQRFLEENVDFDGPLVDCEKKGHKVELVGEEDVEGTAAYHLKLTLGSGSVQEWYLSKEDYRAIRKITPAVHRRAGPYQRVYYLMEHQETGGVTLPFYVEREDRQHVRAYTVDKVEAGVELDEKLFEMPVASPAPPP